MSTNNKPIKATIIYLICSFLQKTIGILTIPIFTRIMDAGDFGVYSVYSSWLTVLTVFVSLNFGWDSVLNGFRDFEDKKEELINSVQNMSVLLAITYVVLSYMFPSLFEVIFGLDVFFIRIMFLQLSVASSYDMWCAKQRYDFKYKNFGIITFIYTVFPVIFSLCSILLLSKNAAYVRICTNAFAMFIIGFVLFIKNAYLANFKIKFTYWIYALKMNLPLVPHYLCRTLLNHLDHIMVNSFAGSVNAAIYSLAYSIGLLPNMLTLAINNALAPWIYKTIRNNDCEKVANVTKCIGMLLFGGIVCLMIIAPEVVSIFAPKQYKDTVYVIPIIAASTYAIYIYTIISDIEIYYESTRFVMIGSIIATVFNAISNFYFIKEYGYMAAAYTTLASFYILLIMHLWQYNIIQENVKHNFFDRAFLIKSMVILSLLSFISKYLYDNFILRSMFVCVIIICLILSRRYWYSSLLQGYYDYKIKE